jgi:predicted TPR repeat methyltransferase
MNQREDMTNKPTEISLAELVALAVGLHRREQLDEAEEIYRRILELAPKQVDTLHFLGVLCHQRGQPQAAADLIRKALRINPDYVDARINLGNVLKESGKFPEAERAYRRALEGRPDNADAYNNLGTVLRAQNNNNEAIECFERAVELAPNHADAFHNLGNALKSAGRIEEALTAYRRAVEIDPRHSNAHLNLGRALYSFGRLDEALIVYSKWLEAYPTHPIAMHMVAACKGESIPERCSDDFVKQSFDAFASSFDDVLTRLEYRAPELVGQAIQAELPQPAKQFRILDAGCGTGLCGPWLQPYARQLIGIDLSPKMLDRARVLSAYDELIVTELTDYMRQATESFDVIVSADTLCYFGGLAPVFAAAAAALRPQGVLVFTLEEADENIAESGHLLNPHGRYSHTQSFVRDALEQTGFELRSMARETLRLEVRKPVSGFVVTARKLS